MGRLACLFSPATCAVSALAKSSFSSLFAAVTGWIASSLQWLFAAAGRALNSIGDPELVMRASQHEYATLERVSPILLLLGLLVATIGALRAGEPGRLWRLYFATLPACVAGVVLARPVASTILISVDQLSGAASAGVAAAERQLIPRLDSLTGTAPGFGLFILVAGLALGTWFLWCELVVRGVVLALLVVIVPLVVPLAIVPSLRRVGWRLFETFTAVAVAKLMIVVTLVIGLAEVDGRGATSLVTGCVTLLLASLSPFVILRILPVVESSSLHAVENLRQRASHGASAWSRSPGAALVERMRPDYVVPPEEMRGEDLGLDMWPGSGEIPFEPYDGPPVAPPVGEPHIPRGWRHVSEDEKGPVIGWHFDE